MALCFIVCAAFPSYAQLYRGKINEHMRLLLYVTRHPDGRAWENRGHSSLLGRFDGECLVQNGALARFALDAIFRYTRALFAHMMGQTRTALAVHCWLACGPWSRRGRGTPWSPFDAEELGFGRL